LITLAATLWLGVSADCDNVCIRQDLDTLGDDDRTHFFNALYQVATSPDNPWNRMSKIHVDNNDQVHGYSNFLMWHRKIVIEMEKELQKIDPALCMHYWNWTKYYDQPENDPIFSSTWLGGNPAGNCLKDGVFANLQITVSDSHCLSRDFLNDTSPGVFYHQALLDEIASTNSDYDLFRVALESGPHAAPHNGCGGDMGQMYSTNDPLFYLHHSFIDKIVCEWQAAYPSSGYIGGNYDESPALLTDSLAGFPGSAVGDIWECPAQCYAYDGSGMNIVPRSSNDGTSASSDASGDGSDQASDDDSSQLVRLWKRDWSSDDVPTTTAASAPTPKSKKGGVYNQAKPATVKPASEKKKPHSTSVKPSNSTAVKPASEKKKPHSTSVKPSNSTAVKPASETKKKPSTKLKKSSVKPASETKPSKKLKSKKTKYFQVFKPTKNVAQKIAQKCREKIKAPMKIPEDWLRRNNLDVNHVRKLEDHYHKLTQMVANIVENNDYAPEEEECEYVEECVCYEEDI